MTRPRRAYEKHACVLLLVAGVFLMISGILFVVAGGRGGDSQAFKSLMGMTWDEITAQSPGIAAQITGFARSLGIALLGFGILVVAIARVPYRKGDKWAWYVLWFTPAAWLGFTVNNRVGEGGSRWPLFLVLTIIAFLGLLLPYRKFFPSKSQ